MQKFMPGSWTVGLCDDLFNSIRRVAEDTSSLECVPTHPAEVVPLLAALDFTQVLSIADMWTGTGGIKTAFQQARFPMVTNDIDTRHQADYHMDALLASTYKQVFGQHSVNAIVSSPWLPVADPALALAVSMATTVVCFHVPGPFVTNAHPARLAYLKSLQHEDRLMCITNVPKGSYEWRSVWLVIFASAASKAQLVRPEFKQLSLSYILA
jgi:hypothetical protein